MSASVIARGRISLAVNRLVFLQRLLLNERSLDSTCLDILGWQAVHVRQGSLEGYVATAMLRLCKIAGSRQLYSVSVIDLFRCLAGEVEVRVIPLTLAGVSQASFGPPRQCGLTATEVEWLFNKAFGPNIIFDSLDVQNFVVLQDFSTCVTVAGEDGLLNSFRKKTKVKWIEGAIWWA